MGKVLALSILFILAIGFIGLNNPTVQDKLLEKGAKMAMSSVYVEGQDELRVFVCGSSSPLPDPNRAQACIAVLTPEHFYIFDSGAGSLKNIMIERLPLERLSGVFLSHFHSDHIAEIAELNLNSWVAGRKQALEVYGPDGVDQIVEGLNLTYQFDRQYRIEHHGEDLLPPGLGVLKANKFVVGEVINEGGLSVSAFHVDHTPVKPAVGYRIEYKKRTLVVSGDTIVSDGLIKNTENVDLLLSDALSLPIVTILEKAANESGLTRNAKILGDIQDYHASSASVVALAEKANIGLTAFYHMVPPPANIIMKKIYQRDLPDDVIITEDRMWFKLTPNSRSIEVVYP